MAACLTAIVVAFPLALITSGLLLPGDPDDPNTKAFLAGAVLCAPAAVVGTLMSLVTVRATPQHRRSFVRTLVPAMLLAMSAWLLIFAAPVAHATPAPETKEDAIAAQENPHLWAPGAMRMRIAAGLLGAAGAIMALRASRDPSSGPARTAPLPTSA